MRFASATSSAAVSSLWRPTSARKSWRLSAAPETGPASYCFSRGLLLLGVGVRLRDLDVVRLELALEQLGVFLADVVLEHERLELGGLELASVLLGALDERLHVLGFEEFDELVLRQRPVSVLSNLVRRVRQTYGVYGGFLAISRVIHLRRQCHKLVTFAPSLVFRR